MSAEFPLISAEKAYREKSRKRCRNLRCTALSRVGVGHALLCFTAKLGPSLILFGDPKSFGIQSEQIVAASRPQSLANESKAPKNTAKKKALAIKPAVGVWRGLVANGRWSFW